MNRNVSGHVELWVHQLILKGGLNDLLGVKVVRGFIFLEETKELKCVVNGLGVAALLDVLINYGLKFGRINL